jgi:hypothetical protein
LISNEEVLAVQIPLRHALGWSPPAIPSQKASLGEQTADWQTLVLNVEKTDSQAVKQPANVPGQGRKSGTALGSKTVLPALITAQRC